MFTGGRFGSVAVLAGVALGILAGEIPGLPATRLAGGFLSAAAGAAGLGLLALMRGRLTGRGSAWAFLALLVSLGCVAAAVGAWRAGPPPADQHERDVGSLVGSSQVIVGTVVDDPRPRADRLQLVLDDVTFDDGTPTSGRILLWLPRGIDARSGDRLSLRATLEQPEDFDGFAYRAYLARQGIGAIAHVHEAQVVSRAGGLGVSSVREWLLSGLNTLVPEPEAALGAGILLGVRAAIAPEINEAFATAGLTHVVAISGWNIAIVAALVAAVMRRVEPHLAWRWVAPSVAVAVVAAYVMLTGASPSVVRAALMAGAILVARLGGSTAHAASALVAAAIVMLLAAPPVLWDVGFQLSLLATAGLIWFGAPIERRLSRWPTWIREPVALTLAAQLTTLPVVALNFERLSLVAPLANVVVVPMLPLAMLTGALAALVGGIASVLPAPLGDALAWLTGGAAWLSLRAMIAVAGAMASVPHASIAVALPAPLALAWYPLLALAAWARRAPGPGMQAPIAPTVVLGRAPTPTPRWRVMLVRWVRALARPRWAALGLVAALAAITIASLPDGRLHLTVLDVGQGDAILIETPSGRSVLIDGGPDPELTLRRLGAARPFFARRIEVVIVSHPHQDHVAGLVEVLARHRVDLLLHAGIHFENAAHERLLADATARSVPPVELARAGQVVALDAATSLEIVYPGADDARAPLPDGDINNGSIVAVLRHGAFRALLTGDAEAPVEALLVERGVVPDVDVLKVGHHGSNSSTTPGFVAATQPEVAIISCGAGNDYGHPAPETLAALAGLDEGVYRTDLHGSVEVVSDGATYQVLTDEGAGRMRTTGQGANGSPERDAASIDAWRSPTLPGLETSFAASSFPTASWSIRRACGAWHWRRRVSSTPPGSPSTSTWWRRPRCCTTSTSQRWRAAAASMEWSARGAWRSSASLSWPCRSPATRSDVCWTTRRSRADGPRCSSPSPIATWPRSS